MVLGLDKGFLGGKTGKENFAGGKNNGMSGLPALQIRDCLSPWNPGG
jgi:hypothetical protein